MQIYTISSVILQHNYIFVKYDKFRQNMGGVRIFHKLIK